MADSIQGLEGQLQGVLRETQAIAKRLYVADRSYLAVLGKAAHQQLLLAAYQVCTTQYPDAFLKLPLEKRQGLQGELKDCGRALQEYLDSVIDRSPDASSVPPDSFQDFVISSLFIQGKSIRRGKGKAQVTDGDLGDGEDLGLGNKTLVVLSDEMAIEDLSEAGVSPERLAEALASALESVIGDEDEDEGEDEDQDQEKSSAVDAETTESRGSTGSGDGEKSLPGEEDSVPDETVIEDTVIEGTALAELAELTDLADLADLADLDPGIDNGTEQSGSEPAGGEPTNKSDRAEFTDGTDADLFSQSDSDRIDPNTTGDGDISSSFLGQYFSSHQRSPQSAPSLPLPDFAPSEQPSSFLGLPNSQVEAASPNGEPSPIQFQDILKGATPADIIQWQRSRERLVLLGLQRFSHQSNQLLRTRNAIPEPLNHPMLEGELALTRDASLKTPNVVALTINPAKKKRSRRRGKTPPLRMVAIHLNLNDLELASPDLSRRSRQIRKLFNQLEQLHQRHQSLHRKLTIAQADQAWRTSWSDTP